MITGLARAAQLADARLSAALGTPEGEPVLQRAGAEIFVPVLSDLPLDVEETLRYSAWCADHTAGLIAEGRDPGELLVALVVRTILTTQLALRKP